ncbi:MAG TPA: GNVR domain-containing protein [Polyangiaceae bacterium]|jgi:tyrosine-protein kinase Etk/Wzc|nr:GNVR domain-containing protein [Polyangiaceae bacterium]
MSDESERPNQERLAGWRDQSGTSRPEPLRPPSEEMDAVQLWSSLQDGKGLIFKIAAFGFLAVLLVTLVSTMQFRAHGSIYLGELDGGPTASEQNSEINLSNGERSDLTSETEILQSDLLVKRAILESGLNVSLAPSGWRKPRYVQWLLALRNPKLLDVAVPSLAAVNAKLADTYRSPQGFRATFITDTQYELWTHSSWLVNTVLRRSPERLGNGTLGVPANLLGIELTLKAGTNGGPHSGDSFDFTVTPLEDTVNRVAKYLTVAFAKAPGAGAASGVVSLEYLDPSPHAATAFLQHLMQAYLETRQSWKTEDATAAEQFVSNQLGTIRESLDKTEKKLADYRTNTKSVVLDDSARAMIEQIGKYEEQRVAARLDVAAFSDMKRALKDPNAHLEAYLMGEGTDTVLQNLASTLAKSRDDLANLEGRFNDASPELKEARAQVDNQLGMIRNYVTNRLNRAQQALGTLSGVVQENEDRLKTVPGAELGLAQLARESEVYSKIYSYLLERQQQMAIIKASRVSKNRVLDAPVESYLEDSPNPLIRLAIMVAIAFAGVAFVLLRRTFSGALQSEADVLNTVGAVAVMTSVPRRPKVKSGRSAFGGLTSGFAEAFRMLRTNLYFADRRPGEHEGSVILVTSPSPGDGKTTVVFGLAQALAADRKTVLMIDGDLHKPSHHTLIHQLQAPGFSELLAGRQNWSDVVRTHSDGVYSITAGVPSSSDLLLNPQLGDLLREMRAHFDFILLDTPSFPLVSDPLILTPLADCVLSVMRLKKTARRLAALHVDRLGAQAASYGIVVNDAGVSSSYGNALVLVKDGGRGPAPPMKQPVHRPDLATASVKSNSG